MSDSVGNIGGSSTVSLSTGTVGNLTVTGVVTFLGFNVTGTNSALLGANAPTLADPTNPQTWITVIDADGNQCVFPAWKKA